MPRSFTWSPNDGDILSFDFTSKRYKYNGTKGVWQKEVDVSNFTDTSRTIPEGVVTYSTEDNLPESATTAAGTALLM